MSNLRHALDYAARGFRVFPAYEVAASADGWRCACNRGAECDRPGKHPRIPDGVNGASPDADKIRAWWGRWPNANIGIATGAASGLTVIDADTGNGKPGLINLTRLCAEHGGVPMTLRVETGGGGLHLYFKFSDALNTGTNVLDEAIDVRNAGGYVIAPPSIHVSGRPYKFQDAAAALLTLPDWMRPRPRRNRVRRTAQRGHVTLEQAAQMLAAIDPDDRDRWLKVGLILGRMYVGTPAEGEAWAMYEAWSARSPKFDEDRSANLVRMRDMFRTESQAAPRAGASEIGIGTLYLWAQEGGWEFTGETAEGYKKFWAIRPANKFLYESSGQLWPAESVNALLKPCVIGRKDDGTEITQRPALWLMQHRGVDSVVFDPALERITPDKVAREQGVVDDLGSTLFNRYQPATLKAGDAREGERWAAHVHKLFPNTAEADHIIRWCAHRVQRPGEKVRHAILMGGPPGVGKDTIFEAMLPALGAWNCAAIAPDQLFAPFNEFAARVFVRISEVVDLHEMNRFKFFEATKTLIAGSPDYVEVNPKYGAKFYARNCAGVVMTTNHPTTGVYLPADDRRHFAVETVQLWGIDQERAEYFEALWRWLLVGDGFAHVAAYLQAVDLSAFDANRPPPKTDCFNKIVASAMTGDAWLGDALAQLDDPAMVRADELRAQCTGGSAESFSKNVGHAMARAGYELLPNPARKDARHRLLGHPIPGGERPQVQVTVYVRRGTPSADLKALLGAIQIPRF